jgi:outer membrane protein assembly factor BamE (lipoprotein component of BamABCDE complex)
MSAGGGFALVRSKVCAATILVLVCLLASGCGGGGSASFSTDKFNEIHPGQTQDEVRSALGDPLDVSPGQGEEYWSWVASETVYTVAFTQSGTVNYKDTSPCSRYGNQAVCNHAARQQSTVEQTSTTTVEQTSTTTVDQSSEVDIVNKQLASQHLKAKSVDCPSDVEAKAGTTFSCDVVLTNGNTGTLDLKVTSVSGDHANLLVTGAHSTSK